jgi:hypothetical protein
MSQKLLICRCWQLPLEFIYHSQRKKIHLNGAVLYNSIQVNIVSHARFNDPALREKGLAFNSCEDDMARMDEQREALEILSSAAQLSHEQDMRTAEVFKALDYLKQCLRRSGAINDFKKALEIQHPDDRERALRRLFNSIIDLVTG